MSPESRRLAGILLVVLPTAILGGVSILRAGHAHGRSSHASHQEEARREW